MPNLTVNDILTDAYQEGYATPEYKASDTIGLRHLSQITQDFWGDTIHAHKANRNWDIWLANTVALQDEYKDPLVSSTTVGASYIETVSIAYTNDVYPETGNKIYTPCAAATDEQIQNWEYYLENQSRDNPVYFQRDLGLFIAPDPRSDEVGTNRIKLTGIRSIASGSWTTSTTEAQTKLPISALDVLKLGLIWKIHAWHRRDRAIILDAKNEYENAKRAEINKMHTETPFINEFPR